MNFLREHAKQLYENGYRIVPIRKGTKHPATEGWENFRSTPNLIKNWWANPNYTGVGVLGEFTIAIDIDVKDAEVVQQIFDYVQENFANGQELIQRVGEAPKMLVPFRIKDADSKFHKIQSPVYVDHFGVTHKLEILGQGNQFVAHHIHPDTKKPYTYLTDKSLLNTKYADLPVLEAYQAKELTDWFTVMAESIGWIKKPSKNKLPKQSTPSEPKSFEDALDNIVPPANVSDAKVVSTLEAIDPDTDMETWLNVGFAMYHQYNGSAQGLALFKTWSAQSANPTHQANLSKLDKRWESFKADPSRRPVTFAFCLGMTRNAQDVEEIEELRDLITVEDGEVGEEPDSDTEYDEEELGDIIAPKKGSKEKARLDKYVQRYVLVGHGKRVIDTAKPINFLPMKLEDFLQFQGNDMIKVIKPTKTDPDNEVRRELGRLWLKSRDLRKVLDTEYAPGKKRIFKGEANTMYANIFHFPNHEAAAKKAGVDYNGTDRANVFLDHLKYLFPVEKERLWFEKWIAFVIQQPQERCPIMPLHVSRNLQGTGRSWMLRVLQKVVGEWNVNIPDVEQLIGESGNFNDHLADCKIIACEEVRVSGRDRYKVENALKSDITDMTKFIRRKHGTQKTERVYGCFLGFTNYGDAMFISQEDRRVNVFSGPEKKNTPEYYKRLMDWLDQKSTGEGEVAANVAQVFSFFEKLDISDFDLSAPMDTKARRTMMAMSKSDIEEMYDSFVKSSEHKVLAVGDVVEGIAELEGLSLSDESIAKSKVLAVLRRKATHHPRLRVGKTQHRLWALDNIQREESELKEEYEKYLSFVNERDFN